MDYDEKWYNNLHVIKEVILLSIKENRLRQIKDHMYDFLIDPSKEKLRDLLLNETGEKNNIDFKAEWISGDSLSKLMLALGNSGGGLVLFGMKETEEKTYEPIGIKKTIDAAHIDDMIKKYVPSSLEYEVLNFLYNSSEYEKLIDKQFQVLIVNDTPERLPFLSLNKSDKIEEDLIYVRRGTKCVRAKANEIEIIINKRIETKYSSTSELDLEQHINHLKILFKHIDKEIKISNWSRFLNSSMLGYKFEDNANYPDEDFEQFIVRMIANKKMKIEKVLDM